MSTDMALNLEYQLGSNFSLWGTVSYTHTPNFMPIGPKVTEEVPTLDTDFTESTFLKTDTTFVFKVRVQSNLASMDFSPS
jgi:hypothetical protein